VQYQVEAVGYERNAMSSSTPNAILRQVDQLFTEGGATGLGEAQLLERYAQKRDEAAFEALVARHGPLVLGVCRRWLRDPHDVEDAFQATFLVLVRRARAIRDGDRLGPWLYGVAFRVASRLRTQLVRQRSFERSGADQDAVVDRPAGQVSDWSPILDEELARLPERARVAVVLCDLEGATCEEASRKLGWPVGTLKSRLSRARARLKDRLTRRGLGTISAAIGTSLVSEKALAALPGRLRESTARAATEFAFHRSVETGSVSVSAAALARGVIRTMFFAKWQMPAAALGLATALCTTTGAWVYARQAGGDAAQTPARETPRATNPSGPSPVDPRSSAAAPEELIQPPRRDAGPTDPRFVPPEELAVRLSKAKRTLARRERNLKAAVISQSEYDDAADDVRLIEAQIQAQANDLRDEIELLELQLKTVLAEFEASTIRSKDVAEEAAATQKEFEKGAAGSKEFLRIRAQANAARASILIHETSVAEKRLRITQAERKLHRLEEVTRNSRKPRESAAPLAPATPDAARP
jgi:RNA polymerase sigma factor (sigma-70 family)